MCKLKYKSDKSDKKYDVTQINKNMKVFYKKNKF